MKKIEKQGELRSKRRYPGVFKGFNMHLRIFILIANTLFLLMFALHINILISGNYIYLADVQLPHLVNYFAIFGMIFMFIMGTYYYLALRPENKKEVQASFLIMFKKRTI